MKESKYKALACIAVIVFVMASFLNGCYYDNAQLLYPEGLDCVPTEVSFSEQVVPILESHCEGCHNTSSSSGSVVLDNYNDIVGVAENGELLCSIEHGTTCSPMPKNAARLDNCSIATIAAWIDEGLLQN